MHNTTHAPLAVSSEEPDSGWTAAVGAALDCRSRFAIPAAEVIANRCASGCSPRSGRKSVPRPARSREVYAGRKYSILECVS
jgi:hypothetical protein